MPDHPSPAITFGRLGAVEPADLIELQNNPLVRRQMPLATGVFDEAARRGFVEGKERLWAEHGYGPWAFYADGRFAGWGGLQPEGGEADLALVLHPRAWGLGKRIYDEVVRRAFFEMGLGSITVLLPPTRTRLGAMARLGLERDGELNVGGERFLRFRLRAPLR